MYIRAGVDSVLCSICSANIGNSAMAKKGHERSTLHKNKVKESIMHPSPATNQLSEHFTKKEFACPCGCGFDTPKQLLIDNLEMTRTFIGGKAIHVDSGCRCAEYNIKVGGAKNSQHVFGAAADIRIEGMTARSIYAVVKRLAVFTGTGVADIQQYIHLDVGVTNDALGIHRPAKWCYDKNGKQILWYDTPNLPAQIPT